MQNFQFDANLNIINWQVHNICLIFIKYQSHRSTAMFRPNKSEPKIDRKIWTVYLLGDQNASKEFFLKHLEIECQEQNLEVNIYLKRYLCTNNYLQIYDFPSELYVRSSLSLYLEMLVEPTIIFYFVKFDAKVQQLIDWIKLIHAYKPSSKMIFISSSKSYLERQHIIMKISQLFEINVLQHVCFYEMELDHFQKCIDNLEFVGLSLNSSIVLKQSFNQRIRKKIGHLTKQALKLFNKIRMKGSEEEAIV